MAAGLKILSTVMSFLIVSISEITPWVFANADAADNSVILDAACFDSVSSIPSEKIFIGEKLTASGLSTFETEPVTETAQEEVSYVFEKPVTEETAEAEETEEVTDDGMIWPVAINSEVVEGFPSYESGRAHHGVDIFVIGNNGRTRDDNGKSFSYGENFRAAKSGVVVDVCNNDKWNTGFGNYCIVDHGDGTQTLYAHAKTIYVELGQSVLRGQNLGEIGNSGNTTAPHLHFEVRLGNVKNFERVNPLDYISEP